MTEYKKEILIINDEYSYIDDEYNSDNEEIDYDDHLNSINIFLNDNHYNIILLLEDIKSRFFYNNPDFLCKLTSVRLTNLIVHLIFHDQTSIDINQINQKNLLQFINVFENEIQISYNIINNFLYKFNCMIDYDVWACICNKFSYYKKCSNI